MLKPGGRIAFYTIIIAEGLAPREYERTRRALAPGLAHRRSYNDMLATAGFVEVVETDVTADFRRSSRSWLEGRERHADELRQLETPEEWRDNMSFRRSLVDGIARGSVRRSFFVARKR